MYPLILAKKPDASRWMKAFLVKKLFMISRKKKKNARAVINWLKSDKRSRKDFRLFKKKIKEGSVLHMDEKPVQVLNEKGRSNTAESRMWLARASSLFFSLIETAKANDLNPYGYLKCIFEKIMVMDDTVDPEELLPDKADRKEIQRYIFNGWRN